MQPASVPFTALKRKGAGGVNYYREIPWWLLQNKPTLNRGRHFELQRQDMALGMFKQASACHGFLRVSGPLAFRLGCNNLHVRIIKGTMLACRDHNACTPCRRPRHTQYMKPKKCMYTVCKRPSHGRINLAPVAALATICIILRILHSTTSNQG